MKIKYFYKFFVFLILFLLSYYAIYFILFKIKTSKGPLIIMVQEKMFISKRDFADVIRDFDPNKKYDLLFVGSSHCYREFDPKIFEKHNVSVYNLGSNAQTPLNTFALLREYIHNTNNVILEVYPVTANLSGEESFLRLVPDVGNYQLLFNMAWHLNDLRCYNVLSIKPLIDNCNGDIMLSDVSVQNEYKGYYETTDSVKAVIKYETYTLLPEKLNRQINYIHKIAKLCKNNNVELCLAYNPVPKELKIINEEFFLNEVRKISSLYNIKFYNYGRNHTLNSKEHFYDDDHLNNAGVEIFNNLLIRNMKEDDFVIK